MFPAALPRGGNALRTLTGDRSGVSGGPDDGPGAAARNTATTAIARPYSDAGVRGALTGDRSGVSGGPEVTGLRTGAPAFPAVTPRGGGVIRMRTGPASGVTGGPDVTVAGAWPAGMSARA